MAKRIKLVKRKRELQTLADMDTSLQTIRTKVAELGDITHMHDDPVLIEQLMQYAEQMPHPGPEKEQIVLRLLHELFPQLNNEQCVARLKKVIKYIHQSGALYKISTAALMADRCCTYFLGSSA